MVPESPLNPDVKDIADKNEINIGTTEEMNLMQHSPPTTDVRLQMNSPDQKVDM